MQGVCIKKQSQFFFYPFYDQYHAKKGLMGSTAVKEREGVNLLEL